VASSASASSSSTRSPRARVELDRGEGHICDTIQSASDYSLTTVSASTAFSQFRDVVVGISVPISVALNMINRSMGHEELYPFVIPDAVLDKLDFVASVGPRA
jgi:hypothetical protein